MTDIWAGVWLKGAWRSAVRLWRRYAALLQTVPLPSRHKFSCRIEWMIDESRSLGRDRFFRVRMTGRIPTPADNYETCVQIEIEDITAGRSEPVPVLSTDELYRTHQTAVFFFRTSKEIVPHKNAILDGWADIEQIPCHVLRFAYRGRRKLLFRVSVLSVSTGQALVSDHQIIEYVSCCDGYQELRGRRLDVLHSCLELAVIAAGFGASPDMLANRLTGWFEQRASIFLADGNARKTIESILNHSSELTPQASCQSILAFGENTDRFGALELAIQAATMNTRISRAVFATLGRIASILEVPNDRFLSLAQKILLPSGCRIDDVTPLLGISETMDDAEFRKRLNEEYRKWNARVTNPDEEIRRQADRMLTLIAELRSKRLQFCP